MTWELLWKQLSQRKVSIVVKKIVDVPDFAQDIDRKLRFKIYTDLVESKNFSDTKLDSLYGPSVQRLNQGRLKLLKSK